MAPSWAAATLRANRRLLASFPHCRKTVSAPDVSQERTLHVVSAASPALWVGFTALVLGLLALDLFVLHRKPHAVRPKEALAWALVYGALALLFCGGVYLRFGSDKAMEFMAGYVIEEAL